MISSLLLQYLIELLFCDIFRRSYFVYSGVEQNEFETSKIIVKWNYCSRANYLSRLEVIRNTLRNERCKERKGLRNLTVPLIQGENGDLFDSKDSSILRTKHKTFGMV